MTPKRSRWVDSLLVAVWAVIAIQNIAAVRLELWRHRMADSYQVLDYLRAADLIRQDLAARGVSGGALVCVDGLAPLPHEALWAGWFTDKASFRDYNARRILAQALGRRGVASIRLDCRRTAPPGASVYEVRGTEVLRSGESIDPIDRLHGRLRALAQAGDPGAARALLAEHPRARPFVIRHLLESLPDRDAEWATNGSSLLVWLDRIAANHDTWFGLKDPKIRSLRAMASAEVVAYVRFLALAQHIETRGSSPSVSGPPTRRLPFGSLPMAQLEALLRSDPVLSSNQGLMAMVHAIAATPPGLTGSWDLAPSRNTADLAFLSFLGRLLLSGWRA